ncbi:hypothetical protein [Bradyrhizobium sp. Ai1a-2]|uniref:hypothetical protein n=1 Tax=Bradyrhizobium sp. Ai1a-2 TaxID=196490 RepID=UPI001267F9E6|nr:hypothetical protein [Bradyrhizobium sp. Ai1a-2]
MKAKLALTALVLSLAPACGAQASTFAHWCEQAAKQRMLTPSAYRRVNLVEWQQPIYFAPYWPPRQPSRLEAFVEYDIHNRFGVPLRTMAKCVYGRDY